LWWFLTAMRARSSRPAPYVSKYCAAQSENQPAGVAGRPRTPVTATLGPEAPRSFGLSKPPTNTLADMPPPDAKTPPRSPPAAPRDRTIERLERVGDLGGALRRVLRAAEHGLDLLLRVLDAGVLIGFVRRVDDHVLGVLVPVLAELAATHPDDGDFVSDRVRF